MSWINDFYTIFHGILASSISFIFFLLLGLSCLPRRILFENRTTNFYFLYGLFGLTIYSFICFYGLQCNVSLDTIDKWMPLGLGAILGGRFFYAKIIFPLGPPLQKRGAEGIFFWLFTYILLYTLTYLFLPQPDPNDYIPVNHIGNTDIFNYINITQDLLFLNNSTFAHSYLHPFHLPAPHPYWAYYQTPGVYYFNAWMSLFYSGNALNASMPILYTTVGLIGTMIAYYCHYFFRCSRVIAAGIAMMILSGTFYRFIIGFYFLSSLMGTVIWLACLISVLQWDFSQKINKISLTDFLVRITPASCLLLLFYPIFFWTNWFILMGVVLLMLFFCRRMTYSFSYLGYLLFAIALVFVLFPQAIHFSLHSILFQANRSDVLWVLPLLSPLSILGFPTYYGWLGSKSLLILFIIVTGTLFSCCYYFSLKNASIKEKVPIYILCLMAIGALCLYWLYFYIAGPFRYQPWKFASYFVLPLAGVFWGLFFKTLTYTKQYRKIFIVIVTFCLTGNFFFYYFQLPKPPQKDYQQLALLDDISSPTLVTKMNNFTGTYLTRFFIRHKHLLSLNYSYYSRKSLNTISDRQPFFLESSKGCQFNSLSKKPFPLASIGCLYYGIPILAFGKHYSFIDNLPFIETHGLFEFFVESPSNKRWEGPTASITFYVKKTILKQHPYGYFHFEVSPFTSDQRTYITWGKGHHTRFNITSQQWITLPYSPEDWKTSPASHQLKHIIFTFRLPDATSPHELNPHSNDMRQRSLDFIQFFMSVNARPFSNTDNRIQAKGSGK